MGLAGILYSSAGAIPSVTRLADIVGQGLLTGDWRGTPYTINTTFLDSTTSTDAARELIPYLAKHLNPHVISLGYSRCIGISTRSRCCGNAAFDPSADGTVTSFKKEDIARNLGVSQVYLDLNARLGCIAIDVPNAERRPVEFAQLMESGTC